MENPTRESLRKFKVVELRQMLSERSLTTKGIKEDLITRLLEYHQAEQEEQANEEAVPEPAAASPEEEESPNAEPVITDDQPMEEGPTEEMDTGDAAAPAVESETDQQQILHDSEVQQETVAMSGLANEGQEREVVGGESVTGQEEGSHESEAMEVGVNGDQPVREESETAVVDETPAAQMEESSQSVPVVACVKEPVQQPTQDFPPSDAEIQAQPPVTSRSPPAVISDPLLPPAVISDSLPPPAVTSDPLPPPVVTSDPLPPTSDYFSATDSAKEDSTPSMAEPANEQGPPPPDSNIASNKVITPPVVANEQERPPIIGPPIPLFEPKPTESVVQTTSDTQQKEKGKRKKKKKRRRRRHDQKETSAVSEASAEQEPDVEIEYIQEEILKPGDPNYRQFHKIFEAFKIEDRPEEPVLTQTVSDLVAKAAEASKKLAAQHKQESSDEEEEEDKEAPKISKKKLRKMNRLTVAQLKQLVDRPDVVEMQDVTAQDPKLLISLKSTRNTVPVPRHWCFKRKYLQGKRGFEKPPFDLPDFIKATGVMEMRQAVEEKEEAKSLKQKTRERVRPKMGKLTIDYQKLHDAFFKWQTKPKMSIHGDLYYEGKEFETRLKQKRPGDLSDDLRRALGMPTGLGKQKFPPPWLVAMQRYGPPPSYPNLKIPGLNAPIPENCSFGYFVGGWGKPPVDEVGRPLYGDVFGLDSQESGHKGTNDDELDRSLWGELESEEEEEESEEESEEEEGEPKPEDIQSGLVTPMEGLVTPSGLTSIPAGLETPEMIQLRKKKIEEAMEQGGETPALYTVLPEMTSSVGGAMMGSSHVYDIGGAVPGAAKKTSGSLPDGIEVALDPSELDLDTATMTARYEEQLREQQNQLQKEDLSDMVAEHAAKQQKKRKRAAADSGGSKATKKLKEFKF